MKATNLLLSIIAAGVCLIAFVLHRDSEADRRRAFAAQQAALQAEATQKANAQARQEAQEFAEQEKKAFADKMADEAKARDARRKAAMDSLNPGAAETNAR